MQSEEATLNIMLSKRLLFCDSQVVANAVAALSEINDSSPTAAAMMDMNSQTINKLLTALNECTE